MREYRTTRNELDNSKDRKDPSFLFLSSLLSRVRICVIRTSYLASLCSQKKRFQISSTSPWLTLLIVSRWLLFSLFSMVYSIFFSFYTFSCPSSFFIYRTCWFYPRNSFIPLLGHSSHVYFRYFFFSTVCILLWARLTGFLLIVRVGYHFFDT